jgi:hypothetical protein
VLAKAKIVEKTVEINKLTQSQAADLAFVAKQRTERRSEMIKGIQANTDKVWTDEKLNKMDEDTLEGIYKSVVKDEPPKGNYSLNTSGVNVNTSTEEALYPVGVKIDVK